jgi:hypothetical protein
VANEFQSLLGKLCDEVKPKIYVETGFMTGESSKAVCASMDKNGFGECYSIEPFVDPTFKHPRLTVVHGYSYDKMEEIFLKTGAWDVFLHDSNHDVGCMTFELELAWWFVKPGGIIACDDYTWGMPPHDAWKKFCERHFVKPVQMGSCQYCVKPKNILETKKEEFNETLHLAMSMSDEASVAYGDKPIFTKSNPIPMTKTYCLTLHETPTRELAAREHFKQRGIDAEFIYGFHAGTCGLRTENNYEVDNPGGGHNIGKHGVGIWTSMIMCYQVMLSQPDTHCFLLEHDAEFDANWRARFDQALKDVPADFDFLFIGHCCVAQDHSKKHIKGDVWKVSRPFCNHASVIAKKALPFVIKTLKQKCWAPVDIQLVNEAFPKLKVYACVPSMAGQFDTVLQK